MTGRGRVLQRVLTGRGALVALAVVVAVGSALRVRQWAYARSLWLDEISIALNLQTRSYRALTGPLDSDQVAPFGWLWVERWVFVHVGYGERALRLLPLLLGCASLVVLALLARRVLSPRAAVVAVGLGAVLPPLVYYSNELKQYSSDTFWVPLMALLTLRCLDDGRSRWVYVPWACAGAVGALFSHAHLLATAGYGLALAAVVLRRRRWRHLPALAAAGAVVLAAAGAVYVVQLSRLPGGEGLVTFWVRDGGFAQPGSGLLGHVSWLLGRAVTLPTDPLSLAPRGLGLAIVLVGAAVLALRSRAVLVVLAAPVVVAFLAALAGQYPLAGRVSLYLIPIGLVVAAAGLDLPWRGSALQAGRGVVAAALLVAAVPLVLENGRDVVDPVEVSETRAAFEHVAQGFRPGDRVFTYFTAGSSALYYVPKVDIPWDGNLYVVGTAGPECARSPAAPQLRRGPRMWLVFGVRLSVQALNHRDLVLAHVERSGRPLESWIHPGAATYLFDTAAQPDLAAPAPPDCLVSLRPPRPPPLPVS